MNETLNETINATINATINGTITNTKSQPQLTVSGLIMVILIICIIRLNKNLIAGNVVFKKIDIKNSNYSKQSNRVGVSKGGNKILYGFYK